MTPLLRSDPVGESEPDPGCSLSILYIGTLIDLFFLRVVPVPIGVQTISVITKNYLYIYKRTTTGVVSITIYTLIRSPITYTITYTCT